MDADPAKWAKFVEAFQRENDWTDHKTAKVTEVSPSAVQKWHGSGAPSTGVLRRVMKVTNHTMIEGLLATGILLPEDLDVPFTQRRIGDFSSEELITELALRAKRNSL